MWDEPRRAGAVTARAPGAGAWAPWDDLRAAVEADRSTFTPGARARRALRMTRALAWPEAHRRLAANPALRAHVAAVAPGDRIFWLSHRFYLVRGLSARDRVALALAHYEHEARRFDRSYLDAVYAGSGLPLWQSEAGGAAYELRLMPGNDVLYEGGLSIVMFVNGERVCVTSFSWAPERIALGQGGEGLVPLVTRKQLTGERGYQAAFHKAFDRVTPQHLSAAALCGIGAALGCDRFVGLATDRHPSSTPERREQFVAAYDEFWQSLGGERASLLGFVVDLPFRLPPLDAMDAKRRRRAADRRAHMATVREAARESVAAHLPPA